jgi:pimeloyl-ACP methyl ester carboxylesterase
MVSSSSGFTDSEFSLAQVAGRGAALIAELLSPAMELGALLIDPVFWGGGVVRGDGRPVMVVPGLFAGDGYLAPMRDWLRRVGYTPLRSGLRFNPGWSEELVNELGERAEDAFKANGRRIAIIGHSMGGAIARSIGVRYPHAVRQVITLGSPLSQTRRQLPSAVRIAALYSVRDPIVEYPDALARDYGARNIEVRSGHTALAVSPEVYRHLAELLSEPETAHRG